MQSHATRTFFQPVSVADPSPGTLSTSGVAFQHGFDNERNIQRYVVYSLLICLCACVCGFVMFEKLCGLCNNCSGL